MSAERSIQTETFLEWLHACVFQCTVRTSAIAHMFTVTELDNICQYIGLGHTE